MGKLNTNAIVADANGDWTSEAIALAAGAKRVYLRVNGAEVLYRDFTVQEASGANLINNVAARSVGQATPLDWWLLNGTGAAATLNYGTAPDGSSEASRIVISPTTTSVQLSPRNTAGGSTVIPVSASSPYTMSWWVKDLASTTNSMRLRYTLYAGAVAGSELYSGDNWAAITAAAGAWVRLSHTFTTAADSTGVSLTFIGGYNTSYSIDLLAWGAKLEAGSSATGTYL